APGTASGYPSTAQAGGGNGGYAAAFAGGIAGGVTRNVLSGGHMRFAQIATDSFGNVLGNSIASQVTGAGAQQKVTLSDAQGEVGGIGQVGPLLYADASGAMGTRTDVPITDSSATNSEDGVVVRPGDVGDLADDTATDDDIDTYNRAVVQAAYERG